MIHEPTKLDGSPSMVVTGVGSEMGSVKSTVTFTSANAVAFGRAASRSSGGRRPPVPVGAPPDPSEAPRPPSFAPSRGTHAPCKHSAPVAQSVSFSQSARQTAVAPGGGDPSHRDDTPGDATAKHAELFP